MTQTTTKTVKKYLTNEGTVISFFRSEYDEGYAYGDDSTVFYKGSTLYSYGYHFALAIRHGRYYFVNADSYSSSTGKHQSFVHRHCPTGAKIEIPFSALERAGISVEDIEVIDKENSKYVSIERRVDGELKLVDTHLMGSTLFKVGERYFISGIDETAKDLWKGFFLTQLVGEPKTVEEAYECMKPEEVKIEEAEFGKQVKRQGEYFFIEIGGHVLAEVKQAEKDKKALKKEALKHKKADLNRANSFEISQSRHVVTNYVEIDGRQFAKGTCRHVAGEHRMLKLDGWHLVVENIQEQSWSSNGRVD